MVAQEFKGMSPQRDGYDPFVNGCTEMMAEDPTFAAGIRNGLELLDEDHR